MKSGNLNFLEPSGPLQACNGTDLPLPWVSRGIASRTLKPGARVTAVINFNSWPLYRRYLYSNWKYWLQSESGHCREKFCFIDGNWSQIARLPGRSLYTGRKMSLLLTNARTRRRLGWCPSIRREKRVRRIDTQLHLLVTSTPDSSLCLISLFVRFTHGKERRCLFSMRLRGPQRRFGPFGEQLILRPLTGIRRIWHFMVFSCSCRFSDSLRVGRHRQEVLSGKGK